MEQNKMLGAILPGNSTVELKTFDIPKPSHGQVLIQTKATTICGSDIRCIYRAHVGKGAEGYIPGTIAGHEPCGIIVEEGPGLKRFKKGDRVIVYHISGCGVCNDCRRGYYISCKSPFRAAYGWQRNGGMAPYILADEKDLVALPEPLTYKDGAQVACGFGTVYEAIEKIGVSGNDAVLVTGLGPVGLAALMLCKAMGANLLIENGSALAEAMGVPSAIIGVTVIAVGTSLPELVTTITAIVKRESALSIGNIIGANVIDLTMILPICSILSGGSLTISAQGVGLDLPACFAIILLGILPPLVGGKFYRWQGAAMLAAYAAYVAILVR